MQREERTLCAIGGSSGRCIVLPAIVHRFATLFVFVAGMADKLLAIRVCPA
jgi:hypothetical protein